jgi:mono/diheme cytochrome c family protein
MQHTSDARQSRLRRIALGLVVCLGAQAIWMPRASAAEYAAMSGKELYERFCAACHGVSGRGDGPVSSSLSVETPDLTLLARRHGGKFPQEQVERIIDGRSVLGAHGSRTMPIWGEDLSRLELGNPDAERTTETIIARLTAYLAGLQRERAVPPGAR